MSKNATWPSGSAEKPQKELWRKRSELKKRLADPKLSCYAAIEAEKALNKIEAKLSRIMAQERYDVIFGAGAVLVTDDGRALVGARR